MVGVLKLEIYVFSDYKGKFGEAAEMMIETMVGMPLAKKWERLVGWSQQQGIRDGNRSSKV